VSGNLFPQIVVGKRQSVHYAAARQWKQEYLSMDMSALAPH